MADTGRSLTRNAIIKEHTGGCERKASVRKKVSLTGIRKSVATIMHGVMHVDVVINADSLVMARWRKASQNIITFMLSLHKFTSKGTLSVRFRQAVNCGSDRQRGFTFRHRQLKN